MCHDSSTDFDEEVKKACGSTFRQPQDGSSEKVIIVGDHAVGKSSLVRRFCEGKYQDMSKATIGVDFVYQKYKILKQDFTLHIWDTAGQEQFRCISKAYFRGAMATILAFDLSNHESFNNVSSWLQEVSSEVAEGNLLFLAGLKSDLDHAVTKQEIKSATERMDAEYWEVSAKKDKNVDELFDRVAVSVFERSVQRATGKRNALSLGESYQEKSFDSGHDSGTCIENGHTSTSSGAPASTSCCG
jgi:small GTP-binding protein